MNLHFGETLSNPAVAVPTSGTQLEGAELNKAGGPGQWQFGPCGLCQNCSL